VTQSLKGKVAIVTGGAGGIGQVYARALAEAGASVAIADIHEEAANKTAEALVADGLVATGVQVDITDPDAAAAMAAAVSATYGGIDILVNNAALMAEIPTTRLSKFPLDWWNKVMTVNVTGSLICAQAVVPSMKERGGGKIINQSSGGAFLYLTPYGISKLAVVGLTAGLAQELGRFNINVNAIAPGAIETEAALELLPMEGEWREQMRKTVPLRGSAPPEDLTGTLLFLASSASDFMTGQCLNVDGGWVMRV
jgi:NAD(P)-dependent dehydrogenase (short-subunit alcohol dehydrogenase family)